MAQSLSDIITALQNYAASLPTEPGVDAAAETAAFFKSLRMAVDEQRQLIKAYPDPTDEEEEKKKKAIAEKAAKKPEPDEEPDEEEFMKAIADAVSATVATGIKPIVESISAMEKRVAALEKAAEKPADEEEVPEEEKVEKAVVNKAEAVVPPAVDVEAMVAAGVESALAKMGFRQSVPLVKRVEAGATAATAQASEITPEAIKALSWAELAELRTKHAPETFAV